MMPRKTLLFATVVAIAGMVAPLAQAAEGDGPRGPRNAQGGVMFNLLDQDGNDSLDSTEIAALTSAIVATADADADGELSQQEVGAMMQALAHRGQRDGVRGQRGHRAEVHGGPRGGHAGFERHGRFGGDRQERRARFGERLGIDEDGLTQEEFLQRNVERFASVHTDADGMITMEEFAAHTPESPRGPRLR